jgi:hypothetical protein
METLNPDYAVENCNEHSKAAAMGYYANESWYRYGEGAKCGEATPAKGLGGRSRLANVYSGLKETYKSLSAELPEFMDSDHSL